MAGNYVRLRLGADVFVSYRSANSSFVVKSSPKAKARNHIPRHPASSVSLLLNVFNTSVIAWLLSVVKLRLPKMLRYVYCSINKGEGVRANHGTTERLCSDLGQACQ